MLIPWSQEMATTVNFTGAVDRDLLKRAKIIAAEGELAASEKLAQTADVMAAHPIALQLRNLQTMAEIAMEKNSTIIFPAQFMSTVQDIKNFLASEKK